MRRVFLLLAVAACARAPQKAPAEARPERRIESASEPLVLVPGTTFRLATGLYELNGELPDDVELVGGPAVVLHTEAGLGATRAVLRQVAIQGGQTGLTVRGPVTLEDVSFSGQRQVGVSVEAGGTLTMSNGVVEGTVPETRGVVVAGRAALTGTVFKGALRHGVRVTGGEASLTEVKSEGAAEAVHVSKGRAVVTRSTAAGGRGPAFYAMEGRLELRDVSVRGHEFAVQVTQKSELDVDGLDSDRAELGAVAAVGSKVVVKRMGVTRAGSHGALELLECQSRVEDVSASTVSDVAVTVRLGRLEARKLRVRQVKDPDGNGGDGIIVRDGVVVLEDVEVTDIGGMGLVATAFATVDVKGLRCEGCRLGALLVERRATVKARGIVSLGSREAAVNLPDDGVLELEGLEVKGGGTGVWAECATGARVVLRGKLPPRELLSGRYLEFPPAGSDSGK
jgi:hypothetical protein